MAEVKNLDENKMIQILDNCYNMALKGIPKISESVEELADNYIKKYGRSEKCINELITYQIVKCGTSGFLTGLGGIITLPITLPANITSVIYVQLRMIASIAYIRGFDPADDEVKTFVYACLTGTAMTDILKSAGIRFTEKLTLSMIKKIPGTVLTKINQKVGFRFITKLGEKGIVNLGKMVPLVGGVIGGTIDIGSTKIIANNAKKLFIQ